MPTLRAYIGEMLRRAPADSLGREEAVASLTATTAVVTAMATGTISSQKMVNKWLWRPDTATAADRIRICSAFTSSTGTFTHVGTNYADTTATSEYVFILEHDPRIFMDAVQTTLARLKVLDRVEIPTVSNSGRYWIPAAFDWIRDPGDVEAIAWVNNPVLSRNRHFEKWNALATTGGTFVADDWTLAGTSATLARSTAYTRRGKYVANLTRVGADATLSQTVPLLSVGVDADDLIGETVYVVGVGLATAASRLRFAIVSGTTTGSTSYHTGGTTFEELSTSITIPTDAVDIVIRAEVNTGNTSGYIDELYCFKGSAVTDSLRRDQHSERFLRKDEYSWNQGAGGLVLQTEPTVRGGQLVLYSGRSYPTFDNARVIAGTADGDSSDAPLDAVSVGAIARLYEGLAQKAGVDGTKFAQLAREYEARFQRMALSHRGIVRNSEGANIPAPRAYALPAARW